MKIGIIQASSQKDKNQIIEQSLHKAVSGDTEIINFGITQNMQITLSYIDIALCISLLLSGGAVDYIITGCSSGQGMMLACNSLPGVLCGYAGNVSDAYLFGRINAGNALSYPLGLNWGWAAEINLTETLQAFLGEPMGQGYPAKDALRKQKDTQALKKIMDISKRSLIDVLPELDQDMVRRVMEYDPVCKYLIQNGTDQRLKEYVMQRRE
ncbi:MAG: RpiB/LacA/LacB family sugar-phosphate isomerase [Butyrivibrio sp.]|nr:RpiB/LacA/LacB family sugar-phosphate isomerase [Butyrivibrio sp.]